MRFPHLFEFMDQGWVPLALRDTLREILECGNSFPFRGYYQWVADEVDRAAHEAGAERIVELGAGTAPITRLLAKRSWPAGLRLVPCDANVDFASYRALANDYSGLVQPVYSAVDFSRPCEWPENTLLFLSATLHHVPSDERAAVIESLFRSASRVLVFEPLRRTPLSILFVLPSLVPALLLPIRYLNRPGRLRRLLWSWLVPVAPLMFLWDGIVSCLREWSDREWHERFAETADDLGALSVRHTLFCQMATWKGVAAAASHVELAATT